MAKQMKVVLINSPMLKQYMRYPGSPLGVAYLASAVRDGNEIKVIDLNVEPQPLPRLLKTLKEINPDLIGMSATTPAFSYMAGLARSIKEEIGRPVVFGGNHVTALPEHSMSFPGIDFVIVKEGERSFKRLLQEYDPGRDDYSIPGLYYKTREGEVRSTAADPPIEPLDDLPYAAWDLLPMKRYRTRFRNFANFMFSRGCPYSCVYCASHLTHGKKIRRRSIGHVLGEIKLLENDYNLDFLAIWDDVLTLDREYLLEFCDRKLSEGLKVEMWGNTRVDKVDPELLGQMKKAGFTILTFGIETGNRSTLEFIKKGTTLDQTRRAVEWTREAGIIPHGFLMVNFPDETEADIKRTIDFAFELDIPLFDIWSAIPYPSTKYETICRDRGLLSPEPPEDFSNYWFVEDVVENGTVPRRRVIELLAWARRRMVMRPLFFKTLARYFFIGAKPTIGDLAYYASLTPRIINSFFKAKMNG